jgi:flagellin
MAQVALSFSGSLSALHKGTAEASSLARLVQSSEIGIHVSANVAGIQISNDRLSVAESSRFAAELRGLEAARSNIAAGTTLLQVADAGLADISAKLGEMANLAKIAAGTGLSDFERVQVNEEFQALKAEIDVIATDARFNSIDLLQGGATPGSDLQVDIRTGTGSGAGNTISLKIASAKVADLSAALGAGGVSTLASATAAKTDVAAA